ncbi:hypothetical protein DQQ10_10470 [Pseudochryseolinea flava]|uniref:DUF4374 domain-containing protein n=1 Tax=Pseudochryseolinea flava TaxID=2059302 RepID=A0A364Y3N2_9BACT|nr:hypothetical protein DQQ10_10470 [Pseudochryseolinea flava]
MLWSCAEETDSAIGKEKFTSIFDVRDFNISYTPLDIVQTSDGGYVVLSARPLEESNFSYSGIHLLKADENGNYVSDITLGDSLVHAVSSLTLDGEKLHFICMNSQSTGARIVSFDASLGNITAKMVEGLTYPSAANYIPESKAFALLGYNSEDKQTQITVANLSGQLIKPLKTFITGLGGGEIIIDKIMIEHFLHTGRQYPFSVGKVKGQDIYYFNAFVNYNFSMGLTNLSEDDEGTFMFGENDDVGFSAVTSLGNASYAIARFDHTDTYLDPNASLSPGAIDPTEIGYNPYPELTPHATIKILPTEISEKKIIVFGSSTKSKQIGLYFYDQTTRAFHTSRYLGFSNPYEFSSMTRTADGGLAICGVTYLAGRFPRICIFKLSEEDVKENVVIE